MKMKQKAFAALMTAVLLIGALAGCSSSRSDTFEPTVSSLFVKVDGTIISADVEDFKESYYSEAELTSFVEEKVAAYNNEKTGISSAYQESTAEDDTVLPVVVDSVKVSDGKAILTLQFASIEDYLSFSSQYAAVKSLSNMTVEEAIAAGESFEGFKNTEDLSVDAATAQKKDSYYLLKVDTSVTPEETAAETEPLAETEESTADAEAASETEEVDPDSESNTETNAEANAETNTETMETTSEAETAAKTEETIVSTTIQLQGEVVYYTEGVTVTSKNTVVVPQGGIYYIIYK